MDGVHPVKAWREQQGLTQKALSAEVGISKAYLCQIETGKRRRPCAPSPARSMSRWTSYRADSRSNHLSFRNSNAETSANAVRLQFATG
ncbi:MAG: helix-turn-helix domain-containing protein [Zoogloeaceae bacterium]|nr:helix-turn-helix domain-containing protein [Zoogloeaceae bacterium]